MNFLTEFPNAYHWAKVFVFCVANIFTSICLVATTSKQHISDVGSFNKLPTMSLTILFALGYEEEANKSFVSEVAQYSSLNYGCKKI